jgi:hypothetical protein
MFRIVLACDGAPPEAGPEAARDITEEFAQHRQWHKNVSCRWDGTRLILEAENDVDANGQVLLDEFSDSVAAYIAAPFLGRLSVDPLPGFTIRACHERHA